MAIADQLALPRVEGDVNTPLPCGQAHTQLTCRSPSMRRAWMATAVPYPCQNGRKTAVIRSHSRALRTASDLGKCRLTRCVKRPSKQPFAPRPPRAAVWTHAFPDEHDDHEPASGTDCQA